MAKEVAAVGVNGDEEESKGWKHTRVHEHEKARRTWRGGGKRIKEFEETSGIYDGSSGISG